MKILQIGIPALTFSLMWLVLSGHFDAFHLSVGALSVAVVIIAAWRLSIFPKDVAKRNSNKLRGIILSAAQLSGVLLCLRL